MATTNHLQAVEKLRVQIERNRGEVEWLNSSRIPPGELKAEISAWVARQARGNTAMDAALASMAEPDARARVHAADHLFTVDSRAVQQGAGPDVLPVAVQMGPALAWLLGDELAKRLHAKVDELDYTPGPPLAERAARREVLVGELRRLEVEEEALICSAEEAAVYIARRPDVDPAVVLNYQQTGTMRELGPRGVPFNWETPGAAVGAPGAAHAGLATVAANAHGMPAPAARAMSSALSRVSRR
jgi:hypothetical protein